MNRKISCSLRILNRFDVDVFSIRLVYKAENVPKTEEEWNKFQFVDKTHWGFYTWPK